MPTRVKIIPKLFVDFLTVIPTQDAFSPRATEQNVICSAAVTVHIMLRDGLLNPNPMKTRLQYAYLVPTPHHAEGRVDPDDLAKKNP
jgi:hypothetical protein